MKKTPLLAVALLSAAAFSATSAHAQGVRLGVKAGANYSNLAGDLVEEDRYESKFGAHGGLLANFSITDDGFFSVQPEVLYSQKGFQYADNEYTIGNNRYKYQGKRNYNYIDVPVLLKINADGFFFEAGPQYSYLLKIQDETERSVNGSTFTKTEQTTNLDNVKRSEIGYAAGLGYQAPAGVFLGIRYNGSFTDFAKEGYADNDLRNSRNSVFQASVGYLFGGK
ncbi:PorT family protein [Hymenobacter lutimineralis]|uniref:PorT family protein n=1 Tax=Hymenobacter lutimineralis TaxID=2606448 RepID=A0A5D6UVR3_9BACT|nr:porin family protein [Hymenobacter lutimineralis]TYZ07065.1 PorT family protein [Hymenobacter lutimineralis]